MKPQRQFLWSLADSDSGFTNYVSKSSERPYQIVYLKALISP